MLSWFRRSRSKADPTPVTLKPEATAAKDAPATSRPLAVLSSACVVERGEDATDYLSTPAVAAYFEAREHEAYYQALKRVGPRRDFRERLIPVLERFIELTDSPPGAAAVDSIMAESFRVEQAARAAGDGSPLQIARAQYPEGTELLNLTEPLTFDSLKSAYRGAVRRNHPDAGGSHDAMVAVSEAFHFVHALLREREVGMGAGGDKGAVSVGAVSDCAAYRYTCGELLFLMALDDWNADTAFVWLERITSAAWQRSPYAQHPWRWTALTEPAGKLAIRLSLAGLHKQASRALAIARSGLREAQKRDLVHEPYVRPAEDLLAGRRRVQVVINHQRQADNALRLGVIDAKRYQTILKRLALSAATEGVHEERLRQFQAGGGFLRDLPTDRVARGKVPQGHLVPEPGYYVTRIEQLTDNQQAEYVITFSNWGTLPLVRKYTFVRLVSLLESALFHPGQVDDAAAEQEARMLASLHDGNGSFYGTEVTGMLAKLRRQPSAERQARAALLKAIDQGSGHRNSVGGITITLTIGCMSPLGMPLSADYFDLINRPLGDLRTMRQTGSLP